MPPLHPHKTNMLFTKIALSGFPVSRRSHEKVPCLLSVLRSSMVQQGHFLGPFLNNYMFIPCGDIVINVLAWKTFCKGLGFLRLRRQVDHSKVFFPLVIMQC